MGILHQKRGLTAQIVIDYREVRPHNLICQKAIPPLTIGEREMVALTLRFILKWITIEIDFRF